MTGDGIGAVALIHVIKSRCAIVKASKSRRPAGEGIGRGGIAPEKEPGIGTVTPPRVFAADRKSRPEIDVDFDEEEEEAAGGEEILPPTPPPPDISEASKSSADNVPPLTILVVTAAAAAAAAVDDTLPPPREPTPTVLLLAATC